MTEAGLPDRAAGSAPDLPTTGADRYHHRQAPRTVRRHVRPDREGPAANDHGQGNISEVIDLHPAQTRADLETDCVPATRSGWVDRQI